MKVYRAARFCLVIAALVTPSVAHAQAFGLNEIGTCAVGRGFAVTGAPCQDASSIYWNPGATNEGPKGFSILAGAAAINVSGSFTRDSVLTRDYADIPQAIVPHIFLNYNTAGRMAFGAGLYVPYGLTSQWKSDFAGRFTARKAELKTFYVQPNVSFRINSKWSIGGGPTFGHSSVDLVKSLDLSEQQASATVSFKQLGIARRTEFGSAELKGTGTTVGFNVGVFGKLNEQWTMGARYLSKMIFDYTGATANFTQVPTGLTLAGGNPLSLPAGTPVDALVAPQFVSGGLLASQSVSTRIVHPDQFQLGFGYKYKPDLLVSFDYAWVGYRKFKQIDLAFTQTALNQSLFEDYQNSSSIRLGLERSWKAGWKARAGFAAVASAAPDVSVSALLPEQDRSYFNLGGALPAWHGVTLDVAYANVRTGGKRGRIEDRSLRTQTADQLNGGVYRLGANVFSLSLKSSY